MTGGVIPPQDYPFLFECGVSSIFGPGMWRLCQILVPLFKFPSLQLQNFDLFGLFSGC